MNINSRTVGFIVVASLTASVFAEVDTGPNGHGPLPTPAVEKPQPATLSERFGTWFVPVPMITLEAMDHGALMAEDEATVQPAPFRFGVERAVKLSMNDGQWIDVDGGRLWRIGIDAIGSLNSRIHLSGLNLPAGQELAITCPDLEQKMTGILEGTGDFGTGEAYGPFSPTARGEIEWFIPAGQSAKELPFDAVAYSYGYIPVFSEISNGGTCSLNPACYAAWLNESNAAARMVFTAGGGSALCSGQLVATTAADETPYVATANHCISTTAEANSCVFYFFNRSPCTGANSPGTLVSGSDLSATYLASDCTLLLVRGALPAGCYWDGWSNANPAVNSACTGIHHPSGTAQAISFGVKNAGTFPCGSPGGNWNSLSWTQGITEGGSSGSAIFTNSDHKMFGVLTCGGSACSNTAADDGYGRWDLAVNTASSNFATRLAAGTDDTQEPNDACANAKAVVPGTYSTLVVKRLDEDWYALPVNAGATLTMSMTFTHASGDIDVQLFTACGGTVALERAANTNNESFTFLNSSASNTVYMRVYLATDTRNEYSFTFSTSTPAPANDGCATASAVGVGAFVFTNTLATDAAPALPASCDEGAGVTITKDLWYRFTAPINGGMTASTCNAATFDTRIAVYSGSACPISTTAVAACSDNSAACTNGTSSAAWSASAGSTWYVRVGSAVAGTSGTATLTLSAVVNCPADMTGNGSVGGDDLAVLLGGWGGAVTTDLNGDGTTNGADLAILLAAWGPCP